MTRHLLLKLLGAGADSVDGGADSGEINGYRTDRSLLREIRRACIPINNADRPFGEWNVFEIMLRGESITIVLKGEKVIGPARLPELPLRGPVGLQHHGDSVQVQVLFPALARIGTHVDLA